jgi:phosphatidate cytidylyltransferase
MSVSPKKTSRFKKRDFWVRLVSALILVTVTLVCSILGGVWFALLVALATAAMAREWVRMSDRKAKLGAYAFAMAGMMVPIYFAFSAQWRWAILSVVLVTIIAAFERAGRGKFWRAVGGLLYIGFAVLAILYIRTGSQGLNHLLYLFAVVWAADSAAYLVGSQVRGPKLWPSISPNKTWSGFAAGILFGIVAGSIMARFTGFHGGFGLELLSAILAIISVGGDLLSSWLKRRFGVKDTGTSIPGHGGVLDRLDALLATSMALAAFMLFFPGVIF